MQLAGLQLTGPADQLETWLGPQQLPIDIGPGPPATTAVVLSGASRATITQIPF